MSDQVEMAFAFDAFTPTIILPASAEEWSDDRRRAVLLHELAHIRRRDLIGHVIAGVACAVYWFNPFVWAAARRLRVESELASDDVVLESGVRPSDYAQHLLDLVTSVGQGAPTVALAMARPREFEGRLVAILDRAKTATCARASAGRRTGRAAWRDDRLYRGRRPGSPNRYVSVAGDHVSRRQSLRRTIRPSALDVPRRSRTRK